MVPQSSAVLHIPQENYFPVARNHSDIAKMASPNEEPYTTIKNELRTVFQGKELVKCK